MTLKYLLLTSCAMAAAVGASGGALAQAPAAPATTNEPESLAEVVVTAQNRAQNVQEVPIRIDVINAEQLADAGFSDANDLSKVAPVAMIQQDQGSVRVTVRGVGNTAGGSTDNSVVTNIDGEYINTPAALGVALFDLERVEVLRGPQGTLYGRNATGGAVNFIMRKPGERLGGNVSASYGNYQAVRLDGGLDVPLATGVGVRVAGFYEDRNGYVKHPGMLPGRYGGFVFPGFAGGRSDDNHAWGGRATLAWNELGGTGFSGYLVGERSKRKFSPQIYTYADTHQPGFTPGPNCANPGWEATAPAITDQTLCVPSSTRYLQTVDRSEYRAPANGIGRQFWDTTAFRGRLDYKFSPEATLSYIGGWRKFERDPKSTGSLPVVYANLVTNNRTETQSHELRLAGTVSGVIYQFGGFYFKEDIENFGGFYLGDITPNTQNFGFYINYNLRDSINKSKSLFGQVEVPLTETLTAVGGARYTDNKNLGYWRDRAGMFVGPQFRDLNKDAFTNPVFLKSNQDKFTWLAGLNWKPDADTLVFAKISTGFKAGGFDAIGTYGPETNTAYEAGLKKNWGPRGRNIFNLTGFYYDYTGLQVNVLLNSAEGGRTFNAGKATNWGIEAETQFELTENDHFNLSINYLNAKLNELSALFNVYCVPIAEGGKGNCLTPGGADLSAVGDLDPIAPGIQSPNFTGHRPAYAPRWIINAGYDHEFDLGNDNVLTARINSTLKSKYFTGFFNYPDESQKTYTSTDASLEYAHRSGVSVTAFVRNIENKRPLTYGSFIAAGPDDIWNWQFGNPRTYGVRVDYKF
jgi:iron complex outermembrane receptor protein